MLEARLGDCCRETLSKFEKCLYKAIKRRSAATGWALRGIFYFSLSSRKTVMRSCRWETHNEWSYLTNSAYFGPKHVVWRFNWKCTQLWPRRSLSAFTGTAYDEMCWKLAAGCGSVRNWLSANKRKAEKWYMVFITKNPFSIKASESDICC